MPESIAPEPDRTPNRRKLAAFFVVLGGLGLAAFFLLRPTVESRLRQAAMHYDRGEYREALALAEQALADRPDDAPALVTAGDACFALEEYDRALEHYRRIPAGSSKEAVHAQLRCGRIEMYHRGDAVAAEAHLRAALQHVPDDRNALFQLASLLGIQARRNEAIPIILRLFRQGEFHRDFLSLLESDDSALFNVKELHRYRDASPDSPQVLVGLAWHARRSKQHSRALALLKRAVETDPGFSEARVALARLLWDRERFAELRMLLGEPRSHTLDDSRFWVVRGQLAERDGQKNGAMRCYWEALRRDQTNRIAAYKLFRYFSETNNREAAATLQRRLDDLQSLRDRSDFVASKTHPGLDPVRRLAEQFERLGRLWEAWGWCRVALEVEPAAQWAVDRERSLRSALQNAHLVLVCRPAEWKFDLSNLPLPDRPTQPAKSPTIATRGRSAITFRDDAASAGISFRYFNSPGPKDAGQRMYEFNGGGCAVLDYDGDGWPDLYFTQGARWPVKDDRFEHLDRLYRNLGNGKFTDVTRHAGLAENRFSTGVTVGDFDNDGFDDLYVANIGKNRLYHNNGDGTFDDVTAAAGVGDLNWSTSCVMADLNGDSLPDIYSVNYLQGPAIFATVCKHQDGRPRMCMPFHFPAAQDQLYVNLGDGRFVNATAKSGIAVPNGKGLGVVVAKWTEHGRIGLFVANDTVPNFLFLNQGNLPDGTPRFQERGLSAGVALNRDGRAEGCMGIAIGDADGDGRLDLFVTNFYRETNTFYRSISPATWEDGTHAAGLADSSVEMLGFGTQFLDADLDGRLDLLVTNGHIDDYRRYGRPYKMPPQFYANVGGGRFTLIPADRIGPYFSRKLLGRALARIDWNRDGREDAVISHLDEPAALLTNTTPRHGRFLAIRLRGVRSSRDAIGTSVTIRTENGSIMRQLTAGDGYQSSNERLLIFGLAEADSVKGLQVDWASGTRESFRVPEVDREYLLIEGTNRMFRLR